MTTIPHIITRTFIQEHKEILFIFGDNLARRGFGGMAYHFRGEPNTFGIRTKRLPSTEANAYFSDNTPLARVAIKEDCKAIQRLLDSGNYLQVVIPDGIGRGRAKLHLKAPIAYAYLRQEIIHIDMFNYIKLERN